MKDKVYEYFKENPETSMHKCASALNIEELEALKLIEELQKENKLTIVVYALGNSKDPLCSTFYKVK